MITPVFLAKVSNSTLQLETPDKFRNYLYSLKGQQVEVVVRLPRKDRSYKQNRFLWGICYELISEATGYTREEIHDSMRMMFLRDEDRKIPTLKSTTTLSTLEMNEYWARIQQFAAEKLNLIIPDPKQVEA